MKSALVVLSGGQDSATCSAWAVKEFKFVHFVTFDYGQRHRKEIEAAKQIADMWASRERHHIIEMPVLRNNPASGLTNSSINVNEVDPESGLPKSFVPGRNLVFLTSAASLALSLGIHDIVTGVCQTDYSGYPDCRFRTISALQRAIYYGNENLCKTNGFRIHTPLMYLTKAETVKLAQTLPGGMDAIAKSWTCYEGGEKPCQVCPACVLRKKGFDEAGVADPAL